jgi:hypothetical protein
MWSNFHDAIKKISVTLSESYTKGILDISVRSSKRLPREVWFESDQKLFEFFIGTFEVEG